MTYASRFSFKLGAGAGKSPTIWQGGLDTGATVIDNGDGTYYTDDLATSGIYSVKVASAYVNGLVNIPFVDNGLSAHGKSADPHTNVYTETIVDLNFAGHSFSGDHTGRYYTETECDEQFCPGDEDSAKLPMATSNFLSNLANEGRLYYYRYGDANNGSIYLKVINRTDFNGTGFEGTSIQTLHMWF